MTEHLVTGDRWIKPLSELTEDDIRKMPSIPLSLDIIKDTLAKETGAHEVKVDLLIIHK